MKRSEMVYRIAALITTNTFGEKISSKELADSILQMQENSGMLPPLNESVPWKGNWADARDYEWEEEDEQK